MGIPSDDDRLSKETSRVWTHEPVEGF